MDRRDRAKRAGAQAIAGLRRRLVERAADMVRSDPEFAASAVELGLIDREWLDAPTDHPISSTAPTDVLQRFLERSVEREPSVIGKLGLDALQLMSWRAEEDASGAAQTLTIVFTDLEGFTAFTSGEGDDAAIALLGEHHRRVGPIIRSRGGRVVKRLGDGLLVAFQVPDAAVLAALELQDGQDGPLRLRVGIHHGEAVVLADDLIGHDVNVAARVTAEAGGGTILATAHVVDAAGELDGVHFGRRRRLLLKGIDERVPVCTVTRT